MDRNRVKSAAAFATVACALVAAIVLTGCGQEPAPPQGGILVVHARGDINSIMAGYLERGLTQAQRANDAAVVIELDTPGGLDSSMREIIQHMNASPVPVIVYVYPPGARAASAGTFITEAAALAAMAPGTNIGAASPVAAGGGDISGTEGTKVTNDAVAFIRSLAQEHGRNADWAESAVRKAAALPAEEALNQHVVDVVAPDLPSLLQQADGRTVRVNSSDVILATSGKPVSSIDKNLAENILDLISDPNIAFLLFSIGGLALVFELLHPTLFVGIFGGISLLMGLFALGTLPTNWAGAALILLAFGLFAADVVLGGMGILAAGGVTSLIVGGLLLVSGSGLQVSIWLVVGVAVLIGLLFVGGIASLYRSRRRPPALGTQTLVGKEGIVRSALDPVGYISIGGETWRARIDTGTAQPGDSVTVVAVRGLELQVRRAETAPAEEKPAGAKVER